MQLAAFAPPSFNLTWGRREVVEKFNQGHGASKGVDCTRGGSTVCDKSVACEFKDCKAMGSQLDNHEGKELSENSRHIVRSEDIGDFSETTCVCEKYD